MSLFWVALGSCPPQRAFWESFLVGEEKGGIYSLIPVANRIIKMPLFANHLLDEGLVPKMYDNSYNSTIK